MQVDWELSQQLVSDGQGVRGAAWMKPSQEADEGMLMAGSQAGGLCGFGIPSASLFPVEYQHNHAVTAVLSLEGKNLYFTGCKDAKIRMFDASSHQLLGTLEGHEKPVTSLSIVQVEDGASYLVSGSWDGTAKLWDVDRRAMLATLPDHENSVCVAGLSCKGLPAGSCKIATGSAGAAQNNQIAGHTVRIWVVQVATGSVQCVRQVANDHDGPIRDIVQISEDTIATCSNDGTVRVRSAESAESLSTLVFQQQQHPPMLLSLATLDDGALIAAAAEDGNVVVWDLAAAAEPQIILHPTCVWNIVALPNGDLATCCDDGTLRIFTRATDRVAPAAEKEAFAEAVQSSHQKKSSGPTPEEIAKLPLWENSASTRGTSEGQVHVFNKGGVAIAAQWSMTSQTWIEVGQVMGSNDGGAIDGVSYDHVLPIEVDQSGGGVAKLQLGYNNGENPFVAAQRFIDSYMLPQHHLNDIANYIQQRVGSQPPSLGGTASPAPTTATAGVPIISYTHLPMPGYKSFDLPAKTATTTLEKMKTKIMEAGNVSESQVETLTSLMETLAATNRYHATKVSTAELRMLLERMKSLSPGDAFPFLDLARLSLTHPHAASAEHKTFWMEALGQIVTMAENPSGLEGPAAVAIPMLSLRSFANAFRGGPGSREAAVPHLPAILLCISKYVNSSNKNVRLSVATALYNVAYYLHSMNATSLEEVAGQVVTTVDTILKNRNYEAEAVIRSLVALGTTVLAVPAVKGLTKELYVVSRVEMAASPHGDVAKAVAKEVYQVLQ
eukprot:Nitzschia sp. Nitz4//scaffold61_size107673//42780//45119//NITZ4_004232-RA/size107673-processed-gene-0.56-mRNA-1//1//CDS//3329555701//364//frame0